MLWRTKKIPMARFCWPPPDYPSGFGKYEKEDAFYTNLGICTAEGALVLVQPYNIYVVRQATEGLMSTTKVNEKNVAIVNDSRQVTWVRLWVWAGSQHGIKSYVFAFIQLPLSPQLFLVEQGYYNRKFI